MSGRDGERQARIEALYRRSKRLFPEVPDIDAAGVERLRQRGEAHVLVDCRHPTEQQVSMIEGAIRAADFEADPPDRSAVTVVTYCTVGHRSGLYAQRLLADGWRVKNFAGSILAWTHAGGALVDADGATDRVHVAGRQWSLEASRYRPVW